jgi:hypothetical protein
MLHQRGSIYRRPTAALQFDHWLSRQCFALQRRPQLGSHARPFAYLRDAHTPVRLPAHGDSVQPRSRVQAGAKSVAAFLVGAHAGNLEVLTDPQPVNALRNLAVLARLLNSRTEVGVSQRDAVLIAA